MQEMELWVRKELFAPEKNGILPLCEGAGNSILSLSAGGPPSVHRGPVPLLGNYSVFGSNCSVLPRSPRPFHDTDCYAPLPCWDRALTVFQCSKWVFLWREKRRFSRTFSNWWLQYYSTVVWHLVWKHLTFSFQHLFLWLQPMRVFVK